MAEGINRMTPEELALVDGYETIVKMLGIETPIDLAADIAGVRSGMPMTPKMRKKLSEQSIQLGQEARNMGLMPNDVAVTEPMSLSNIESLYRAGQLTEDEYNYFLDGRAPDTTGKQESVPSPDPLAANTSTPSTSTDGTVMGLEELIAAGIVTPPTRPQARPMMTSPRPQARPTAPMQSPRPQMRR